MDSSPAPRRVTLRRFLLFIATLELIAIGVFYLHERADDPETIFSRMASGKHVRIDDSANLKAAAGARLIPLLVGESGNPDEKRSRMAVTLASTFGVAGSIPPENLVKVMLAEERDSNPDLDYGYEAGLRKKTFAQALALSSGETRRQLFDDLASNKRSARENNLISIGLAYTADADLVDRMHKHLASSELPVNYWPILKALAARTDLPLTDNFEDWPVYRRHLPGILDPETHEAKWVEAVALARDLPKPEREPDSDADPGCGVVPPADAPLDVLSPRRILPPKSRIAWPMSDEEAAEWEQRVNSWRSTDNPYTVALLLHWRRSRRLTLPYYPYGIGEGIRQSGQQPVLSRPRGPEQAKQVLNPNRYPKDVAWTLVIVGTGPRTERGGVLATAVGRGPVRTTVEFELSGSGEPSVFRLGIRNMPEGGQNRRPDVSSVTVDVRSERLDDGGYFLEGGHHVASGGGGSLQGYVRTAEATVLDSHGTNGHSSSGSQDFEDQQQAFTLLIPGETTEFPESEWRRAVGRFLSRWAEAPKGAFSDRFPDDWAFQGHHLSRMVRVASWIPIPEARAPLRKLWERRNELSMKAWPDDKDTLADWVGAALLLTGDDAPLEDSDLHEKLPTDILLRIYCFSPNPTIWLAVDQRASNSVNGPIAAPLSRLLADRGDTRSKTASKARALEWSRVLETIPEATPVLLIALVLFAAAWFPRASGNRAALAASLVGTGLVLQFITMEAMGRVWLPMAGDALFLAAALLQRRRFLVVLTAGLAVCGLIQFVNPVAERAVSAGQLLLVVYLAALSLDQLARPNSSRSATVAAAHLALWILMIVPLAAGSAAELIAPEIVFPTITQLKGCWVWAYVAALFLPPFIIVYDWRRVVRAPAPATS